MKYSSQQKGFTLIEMIVSIALFAVVALISVGALLKVIDANKKSESLKTAVNNMNFTLDSMSRELRTGTNYYCTNSSFSLAGNHTMPAKQGCPMNSTDWEIVFYSSKTAPDGSGGFCNLVHAYRYASNTIQKAEQQACSDAISTNSFAPLISPDVVITTATANVLAGSGMESLAFFHLVGYSGVKETSKTYFDIQTSVSERVTD